MPAISNLDGRARSLGQTSSSFRLFPFKVARLALKSHLLVVDEVRLQKARCTHDHRSLNRNSRKSGTWSRQSTPSSTTLAIVRPGYFDDIPYSLQFSTSPRPPEPIRSPQDMNASHFRALHLLPITFDISLNPHLSDPTPSGMLHSDVPFMAKPPFSHVTIPRTSRIAPQQ